MAKTIFFNGFAFWLFLLPSYSNSQNSGSSFKSTHLLNSEYFEANKVIVKFKNRHRASKNGQPELFLSVKPKSLIQKFPASPPLVLSNFAIPDTLGIDRIHELELISGSSIENVLEELCKNENVEYAEPKYINRANYVPNDILFLSSGQQYLGQIKAPAAWDIFKQGGSLKKVIIAIVDNGPSVKESS